MSLFLREKDNESLGLYYACNDHLPIYVHSVGTHRTPHAYTCGPATRPYYLLHLIVSGYGTVERRGEVTRLTKGDCFVIRPGEIITYSSDKDEPWEYYWISFNGSMAQKLLQETTDKDFTKYKKQGYLAIKTALDDTISDNIGCLQTLFTVLDSIKKTTTEKFDDFVKTAINYIETNYFHNFNATNLANMLSISRTHFSTTFTKRTGKSPYTYILDTRINHAIDYLLTTDMSITEIAYSVGFSSIERFSECFKAKTSLSPKEYRALHKNK